MADQSKIVKEKRDVGASNMKNKENMKSKRAPYRADPWTPGVDTRQTKVCIEESVGDQTCLEDPNWSPYVRRMRHQSP